ncbi:helix-turn-helix domain-containing protein [Spongiivirga sp. MCCC 1A20706]|uniref:helix-turn-helix domain-containing protein n=1 Tax=Spongiivirga sp. MCCC 1A20706 TaxID=3160963 RepID=UPI0039772777
MNTELQQHIELLFGSIGVILGLFFSIFLLISRKKQPKANIFLAIYLIAFSLRIGKSLFHNYFEIDATLRTYFLTIQLCIGPSLLLYSSYLFKREITSFHRAYIHYIPFFVLLSIAWLIPNNGNPIFGIFYTILIAHMFGYTLFSLFWLNKPTKRKATPGDHKIKTWLHYFLGANLLVIILYFLISEMIIPFYLGLSFLFSLVIIFFSFWALKNPFLFRVPAEKYKHSPIDDAEAFQLVERLKKLMNSEKPYLNPSLTLLELSTKLAVSSKALSQAINQTESLNYSQFVSKYRIEEVKRLLRSDSHAKFTIAAIAYDSGFNSISSFNAAFKKHTGTTALDFRKAIQAD